MASNNFAFLKHHDELLVRLVETAEMCFSPDPNTTLIKMRQLGEELAKTIASRVGVESGGEIKQVDLLRNLDYTLRLDTQIKDAFHTLRKLGNSAAHDITSSTHRDALNALQVGHALCQWFHITFGGDKAAGFKKTNFVKPVDPSETVRQLEEAILELQKKNKSAEERLALADQLKQLEADKAQAEKQRAEKMASESKVWEELAIQHEEKLAEYRAKMDAANIVYFSLFNGLEKQQQAAKISYVENSTLQLTEAETRVLIDQQLIEAGWEVDSVNLKYANGARPIPNKNRAIAEWPTDSGPADYVLFIGLTPVAVVEAKKNAKNIYSSIDQAKRYAKGLQAENGLTIETTYGDFKVPLTFATNGRPYLKQLEQEKPEDYLNAFKDFVNANSNRLIAIQTVINKPWALTRQRLKALAVELDLNHFREKDLQAAWKETKQEEIAARIIGFIRQAALGEALIPWEQRVDKALEKIMNSQPWKTPQRDWLTLIAEQMKATTIVDEAALSQGVFQHQGGIKRANKLFEKPVTEVLEQFNQAMWN